MDDNLPRQVIDHWFPGIPVGAPCAIPGGLSGARVWRVDPALGAHDIGASRAIRRWPQGVAAQRVAEIHRVARHAVEGGCEFIPRHQASATGKATTVWWRGHVWDCADWVRGEVPSLDTDPIAVVAEIGVALARFHRRVATLGTSLATSDTVASRVARITELDRRFASCPEDLEMAARGAEADADLRQALITAARVLRQRWRGGGAIALDRLAPWRIRPLRSQYVLRDIHLGNCLFYQSHLSGIVDLDAIRVDTPAADLARLLGSVQMLLPTDRWRTSAEAPWNGALAAYRSVWAFSAEEEELARTLHHVNPMINLANWVVWIVLERRTFPADATSILQRVEQWTRVVADENSP